jgi:hypothetical protein
MSIYALIRETMEQKVPFSCTYNGLYREVCAHTLGLKKGKEQVLVFQYAGESTKGLPPEGEWRCLPVAGVENFKVIEGPWHTDDRHSQKQTCVDEVDLEVFS